MSEEPITISLYNAVKMGQEMIDVAISLDKDNKHQTQAEISENMNLLLGDTFEYLIRQGYTIDYEKRG